MTYDVAIMIPIMEMAGYEKIKYINKVLYIYNRDNPISDDKVNQQLQWDIHTEIIKKSTFKQIDKLPSWKEKDLDEIIQRDNEVYKKNN